MLSADFCELISAIQRDPADDGPRWAFADLCDKSDVRDDQDRASFVRYMLRNPSVEFEAKNAALSAMSSSPSSRFDAFRLMWTHYRRWGVPSTDVWERCFWNRGFVDAFKGQFSLWLKDGWKLLRQHPVAVVMTEKSPCPSAEKTFFYAAPVANPHGFWPDLSEGEDQVAQERFILTAPIVRELHFSRWAVNGSLPHCAIFASLQDAAEALSSVLIRMALARCADKDLDDSSILIPKG